MPHFFSAILLSFMLLACSSRSDEKKSAKPQEIKKYSKVVGWGEDKKPLAPIGFKVTKYADGFRNPRHIYVLPNGDILVAEAESDYKDAADKINAALNGKSESQNMGLSANRITLLRDSNQDGKVDKRTVFLKNLNQPFGMLLLGNTFFVANTDSVWSYTYTPGSTEIKDKGKKILDLPKGGYNNHWTRNLLASADGKKIYVSVGSASNVAEHGMKEEERRANILEINPDGTGERVLASGLRNPVGMSLDPRSKNLWTVVNERDYPGDDLVSDYLTSVKDGGFYGWPYFYWGQNPDPRRSGERDDLKASVIVPDLDLGSHTASLGLTFFKSRAFGHRYQNGAFIGQHGSWNSSKLVGYKVVFVPMKNGKPGKPEDFLTGFIKDEEKGEVFGRPIGVTELPQGQLLVADDSSNTLWLVEKESQLNYTKTKTGYFMVLKEGDDILGSLEALAVKEKISSATFTGMGFAKTTFGFFNADTKEYEPKSFPPMELASLSGSIAWEDGEPSLHSHGLVSGSDFEAFGGHLLEGIVGRGTLELTIQTHGAKFKREQNDDLGAKVLHFN